MKKKQWRPYKPASKVTHVKKPKNLPEVCNTTSRLLSPEPSKVAFQVAVKLQSLLREKNKAPSATSGKVTYPPTPHHNNSKKREKQDTQTTGNLSKTSPALSSQPITLPASLFPENFGPLEEEEEFYSVFCLDSQQWKVVKKK
jgi:hypothetical protein